MMLAFRGSVVAIVVGVALLLGMVRMAEQERLFALEQQHHVALKFINKEDDNEDPVDDDDNYDNNLIRLDLSSFIGSSDGQHHWKNKINWDGISTRRQEALENKILEIEKSCNIDASLENLTLESLERIRNRRGAASASEETKENETIPRTIYMFWDTGFATAKKEAQEALISWEIQNPSYQIHALDRTEAEALTERSRYIPDSIWKNTSIQGQSDIYRTLLLYKYGGIWVDASTTSNYALDDWLSLDQEDIVSFVRTDIKAQDPKLHLHPWMSSWFLAVPTRSKIMSRVFDIISDPKEMSTRFKSEYFWWHRIVAKIANEDQAIRSRIEQTFPTSSLPLCHVPEWETAAPFMKRNAVKVMEPVVRAASLCCRGGGGGSSPVKECAISLCENFNCTVLADNIKVKQDEQGSNHDATDNIVHQRDSAATLKELDRTTERRKLPLELRLLRVPKAGSSSFSAFLRVQYNCTSPDFPPGHCTKDNGFMCLAIKECHGHKPPPVERFDDQQLPPMVSFVRDPIERYISAYNYPGHHSKGTNGNIKLHTMRFPQWNDAMTNYFSSHQVGTWHFPGAVPKDASLSKQAERLSRLDAALQMTLRRTVFVGLLEYWDDSLRLFCRMFQCHDLESTLSAPVQRKNRDHATTKQQGYPYNDETTMEAIRQANALDLLLYQATSCRFCKDLAYHSAADELFRTSLSSKVVQFCEDEPCKVV